MTTFHNTHSSSHERRGGQLQNPEKGHPDTRASELFFDARPCGNELCCADRTTQAFPDQWRLRLELTPLTLPFGATCTRHVEANLGHLW